jgi:hypothetical protein
MVINSGFFSLDDLPRVIEAAVLADPMGALRFLAIGADRQAFHFQGVMGSSFIFSRV